MANLVITSNTNRILIAFNDYATEAGMTNGDWAKVNVSVSLNIGDIDMFFIVENEENFRFSYNGSAGSMQVDTVDGAAPVSNADLKSKIDAILAVGGNGLSQQEVLKMVSFRI